MSHESYESVLPAGPDWRRWKRRALLTGLLGLAGLIGFLALWNTFFVYVKPGRHLVVITKFGERPSKNQLLAEPGQEGIQRAVLGEGWHLLWPILYSSEVQPNVVVPAGKVGVVMARGGDPLAPGQALADEGQQGIQRKVLTPGEYRINRYGYDVELADAIAVRPGYVGVVRRLLGDNKGILPDVLQPGLYFLNPKEFEVIHAEVGIYQTSFKYDRNPTINTAIKFTSKGGFEISMDCTVEWEVLPQDMPALVAKYGIVRVQEDGKVVLYADRQKVEDNVIQLQAHAISRNKGIDYGVQEILQGTTRERFQADFRDELVKKCSEKGVALHSAFIRDIVIPEAYLRPIRDKQIAAENELTNQAKQVTADSNVRVERERQLVLQRVAEVHAESARMVAAIDRAVLNIGIKTQAEVDKLKADYESRIAILEAERTNVLGAAQAEVAKLKDTAKNSLYQMKMEVFQNDANAFLRYTLAESLNPKLSMRLMHSGPGTFWTNMDGKGFNLFMPAPDSPRKPGPIEKEKK